MKKILLGLLVITGLVACKREYNSIYTFVDKENKAQIKLIHTVTNASGTPKATATAGLQVYLNDTKITATNLAYGTNVYPGLEFALVNSGQQTLKAVVPKTDTTQEVTVVSAPVNLESGKTYSAFFIDTMPNAELLLKEENLSVLRADSGKYYVRIINLVKNSTGYDLFATTDAQTLETNVTYKTISDFKQLPTGGSRSFAIRKTGLTTNLITGTLTAVAGRVYTFVIHGTEGGTGIRNLRIFTYTTRFQQ